MPTALPWRFLSIVAVGFLRLAPRLQFITSSHKRIIFFLKLLLQSFKKNIIFVTITSREILFYYSPLHCCVKVSKSQGEARRARFRQNSSCLLLHASLNISLVFCRIMAISFKFLFRFSEILFNKIYKMGFSNRSRRGLWLDQY